MRISRFKYSCRITRLNVHGAPDGETLERHGEKKNTEKYSIRDEWKRFVKDVPGERVAGGKGERKQIERSQKRYVRDPRGSIIKMTVVV